MAIPPSQQVQLYRRYLQHLRLLPDPHIWGILQPRFKCLVRRSGYGQINIAIGDGSSPVFSPDGGESSSTAMKRYRSDKALRKANKLLNRLRAAVACHPHSLTRLIEEVYGQRGSVRWDLLRSINSSYQSPGQAQSTSHPLPAPLLPLKPPPLPSPERDAQPRARRVTPACVLRARERRAREREWALVKVPLVIPSPTLLSPTPGSVGTGAGTDAVRVVGKKGQGEETMQYVHPRTGWEDTPIIQNLRILAALDTEAQSLSFTTSPRSLLSSTSPSPKQSDSSSSASPSSEYNSHANANALDISYLPPTIQRIFPTKSRKYKLPEEPYAPPPPRHTRQNPNTWGVPHRLTARMLIRAYRRLWESLVWVRPSAAEDKWEKCTSDQLMISSNPRSVPESNTIIGKQMKQSRRSKAKKEKGGGNTVTGTDDYKWNRATDQELRWLQSSLSPQSIG